MIFDLMTSPQGHQFDPGVKILLAFCSTHNPRQFDMPHDHVRKNKIQPPVRPWHLQVPPLWHDLGIRTKIPFNMFHIFN